MPRAKTPRNGSAVKNVTPITQRISSDTRRTALPSLDLAEEIRRRAYELYEERGCTPGREQEDWVVAEREILARHNQQSA